METPVSEIQSYMISRGWRGNPAQGFSVKKDENGRIIARRGDMIWIKDMNNATEWAKEIAFAAQRLAVVRELERREASNGN